jgi:hypothetical protein
MKRLRLSKSALSAWALMTLAACSSKDPISAGNLGAFVGQNKMLVDTNCSESMACQKEMGLEEVSVSTCEVALAQNFSSTPSNEAPFLHAVNRCGKLTSCDFTRCATLDLMMSHADSFGDAQVADVTYGCQQKIQCAIDMKESIPDPTLAVNNCVAATQGTMYTWSTSDQNAYLANFAMCGSLTSCDMAMCYEY